jgi:hypothetical protein
MATIAGADRRTTGKITSKLVYRNGSSIWYGELVSCVAGSRS